MRMSCGVAAAGLAQDVAAAADALARVLAVPASVGSFWRVSDSATGPDGAPAIAGRSIASAQAAAVSFASPGPDEPQVRDRPQRRVVLDRLVGRAVLAEPDRVVGPDVDHVEAAERREPDRRRACSR